MRRLEWRAAVATDARQAHVIRQHEDDVQLGGRFRPIGALQRGQRREKQGGKDEDEVSFHFRTHFFGTRRTTFGWFLLSRSFSFQVLRVFMTVTWKEVMAGS
jgi:hypothetical protein